MVDIIQYPEWFTVESGGNYKKYAFDSIKAVVDSDLRSYDPNSKKWYFDNSIYNDVSRILNSYYGYVSVGTSSFINKERENIITLFYVGIPSKRKNGTYSYGYVAQGERLNPNGAQWNYIISEELLIQQFGEYKPNNYFSILGLQSFATDLELKSAYRRLVKQWHPDVCKEINANEQFNLIQTAYEKLKDSEFRNNYGRRMKMAEAFTENVKGASGKYIPRLRCGILRVKQKQYLSKVKVTEILQWDDITNNGLTAIAYWNDLRQSVIVEWR